MPSLGVRSPWIWQLLHSIEIYGGDFAKIGGLLRIYELYQGMKLHNMQLCGALVSIAGYNSSFVHFSLTLTHSALHPTQGRMPKNLHCKRKPAWQLLLL